MKIANIGNLCNSSLFKGQRVNTGLFKPTCLSNPFTLNCDVVSFKGKDYNSESVANPTSHCAYCGCKVYNETQIEGIAKEILNNKAARLEGHVRSVLEKFDGAKHSQEIASAKAAANKEYIDFFNDFLEIASKKSYMKGEAIFAEIYHLDREKVTELLVKNLRPLLRTIDHVSPQNLNQQNNNVDINLVEACYTCNHDLKQGTGFDEFYTMFPDIRFNMPSEKFKFAQSHILDSSKNEVSQRLSARNLLKFIDRLFTQRTETLNLLSTIGFRIKNCRDSIDATVEECQNSIKEKQAEVLKLKNDLAALQQDPEFIAILERNSLNLQINSLSDSIDSLRKKRELYSNNINELRSEINPKKKRGKKNTPQTISLEEKLQKEEKINNLKQQIVSLSEQIEKLEEQRLNLEIEVEDLDSRFPTSQMLEIKKHDVDAIISSYKALDIAQNEKNALETLLQNCLAEIEDLEHQLTLYPKESFDIKDYSQEEKDIYALYSEYKLAERYISDHSTNQGQVRNIINSAAQKEIKSTFDALENTQVIIDYNCWQKNSRLNYKLDSAKKQRDSLREQIKAKQAVIDKLKANCSEMQLSEARKLSLMLQENIRNVLEKENQVNIPDIISTINNEIELIQSTINDLLAKKAKIDSSDLL